MATKTNIDQKLQYVRHVTVFYAYIFIVWGFYRLLIQFPEVIEETIVKPLIWLVPVYILVKREGSDRSLLGLNANRIFPAIYGMLTLGFIFAVAAMVVNYLKYNGFYFASNVGQGLFVVSLGLSIITAITEEIAFRGYLFGRLQGIVQKEWLANGITSVGWLFVHFPNALFNWGFNTQELVIYSILVFGFSLAATFMYARTKTIIAPVLLHILWQWPIILFR